MSVTSEHETLESRPFVCRSCRHSNPAPCRFCGKCGERLWEPCLGCGETNPCNVTYCGHCGTNVEQAFEQRLACIEADQQKAERLRADGMYHEAIGLLSRLESGGDSRLERLVQVAQQRAEELRREHVDRRQEAETVAAIAAQRLQQKDYAGAKDELARVPPGLRDQAMQELWARTQAILREIADLTAAVRRAHAVRDYDQLLPLVLRLQELCPHDAKLARLIDDLQQRRNRQEAATAEQRLHEASELLGRGDYTAAAARLTSLSTAVLTSEQRDTYDKIRELGWITSQLKTAGAVTSQLASIAQRLTEMHPQDERATRASDELARRLKMHPADVRFAVPWGKLPAATRLGCPVRWWRGIQVEAGNEAEPWLTARDRLMVAYGLALQGLGVSRLKLNLLPPDRASWLKRWTSSRSPQSCNQVWGIDLGTSGLKAVELSRERQSESIQLIRAVHLPHRRPLNSAENDGQVTEICRETVQRFVEQCQLRGATRWSVSRVPGRWDGRSRFLRSRRTNWPTSLPMKRACRFRCRSTRSSMTGTPGHSMKPAQKCSRSRCWPPARFTSNGCWKACRTLRSFRSVCRVTVWRCITPRRNSSGAKRTAIPTSVGSRCSKLEWKRPTWSWPRPTGFATAALALEPKK